MLRLPVLPSCFLLIARPSGLIGDPGATRRTAPLYQGTECSGLSGGCKDHGGGQSEQPEVGSGSFDECLGKEHCSWSQLWLWGEISA